MRFSYFMLLAAATLLASCDVVCADVDQTKLSKMTSPDAAGLSVHAIGAANEKRRLRSHYDEDEGGEGGDDNEEEEERFKGANLFQESKLKQMLSGVKEFKRYKKMKAYGYTPSLQEKLTRLYGKKYKDLWERFTSNYYTI